MKRLLNHSDGLLRAGRSVWFRSVLRATSALPPELQRGRVGGAFGDDATMPSPSLGITLHGSASLRLDQISCALRSVTSFGSASGQRLPQQHVLVVENAADLNAFRNAVVDHAKRVAATVRNGRLVLVVLDERKVAAPGLSLPYAAVAPAIEGFTRSLAKELGSTGTTVNALMVRGSSSSVDAAMRGPLQAQLLQPLSFFLAPDSAFVSGQTVVLQLDRLLQGMQGTGAEDSAHAQATQATHEAETSRDKDKDTNNIKDLRFLSGRVAVVTGAARGIGAAIASRLAAEGATVVGVDVPAASDALAATMRSIAESSATASASASVPLAMDITQADAPARLHDALLQLQARRLAAPAAQAGGSPYHRPHSQPLLHIMVHNAGITRDRMLRAMDDARWGDVQAVNLDAILRINRELLGLGAGGGVAPAPSSAPVLCPVHGRVISLSSINGIAGARGQTNYAWTKGALIGYTEALGEELHARYPLAGARLPSPWPSSGGVGVLDRPSAFAVAPGFIETAMVAKMPFAIRNIGRRSNALLQGGLPEDVAAAVAFLCLPGAAAASGSTLRVCGGNMVGK